MRSLSSHLLKRLTRLSGLVPSGILVATLGSWVLLLPTIPLKLAPPAWSSAWRLCLWGGQDTIVLKCPVWHDIGGGCHSFSPSFWVGRAFQARSNTMKTTSLKGYKRGLQKYFFAKS